MVDPGQEGSRAGEPELRLELKDAGLGAVALGGLEDERGVADLVRSDALEVVDEEDRCLRRTDQFVCLFEIGALAFGVNRLAEVSRSLCASSRIRTSTSFGCIPPNWLK